MIMNENELLELRKFLTVAHHIPGRLRLKLDPGIRQHPAASLLANFNDKNSGTGMLNARLNLLARSLVIEYDPAIIPPDKITDFLTGSDIEQVRQAAETIAKLFGITLSAHKK